MRASLQGEPIPAVIDSQSMKTQKHVKDTLARWANPEQDKKQ